MAPKPIPLQTRIEIRMVLTFAAGGHSEPLVMPGRVVWCTALFGSYQIGVMFSDLDRERARQLADPGRRSSKGRRPIHRTTRTPTVTTSIPTIRSGRSRGKRGRPWRDRNLHSSALRKPRRRNRQWRRRGAGRSASRHPHVGGDPHLARGLHRHHARPLRGGRRTRHRPRARRGRGDRAGAVPGLDGVETETPPLWVKAKVAWTGENDDGHHTAGVRFAVITNDQRAWLRGVLAHVQPSNAAP